MKTTLFSILWHGGKTLNPSIPQIFLSWKGVHPHLQDHTPMECVFSAEGGIKMYKRESLVGKTTCVFLSLSIGWEKYNIEEHDTKRRMKVEPLNISNSLSFYFINF